MATSQTGSDVSPYYSPVKPTVVHLITALERGGAEISLHRLLKWSQGEDQPFQHVVISMTERGAIGARIQALGIPVYTLGMQKGAPGPSAFFKLCGLLWRLRPDIVQSWLYHADLLGLIATRFLAKVPFNPVRYSKVFWNIRNSRLSAENLTGMTAHVLKFLVKLSPYPDAIVVNSMAGQSWHAQMGYRPKRWQHIPNGIDSTFFKPRNTVRKAMMTILNMPEDALLLGMVARYDPSKDFELFVDAAASILKQVPQARFLLVGRGLDEANTELMHLIAEQGLEGVFYLLGERTDLERIYSALDLFCLASHGEGFPNVLAEAMASGTPCVATDVGDVSLLLEGFDGIVPSGDADAFATEALRILQLTGEERTALGSALRERITTRYGMDRVVENYNTFYLDMLD